MAKAGGKAAARITEKRLQQLGYKFGRINSHQWWIFTRAGSPDVSLNPSISERDARHLVRKVEHQLGIEQASHKRNAQAVKDRQRAERIRIKAEMDRLDAERAALIRRKELLPTGDLDELSRGQRLAIEREINRIENERREWERLMAHDLDADRAKAAS